MKVAMAEQHVEAWMRGPLEGVEPFVQPLLFSFTGAREDFARWTEGLTPEQLWARPFGIGAAGFHIRHAGGSAERLSVYLVGGQLSAEQLEALKREADPGASREELLEELERAFAAAEKVARGIDPKSWTEPRFVGRKRLPTTVGGLVTHIAEHTQRHLGAAIVTLKVVRGCRPSGGGYSAS